MRLTNSLNSRLIAVQFSASLNAIEALPNSTPTDYTQAVIDLLGSCIAATDNHDELLGLSIEALKFATANMIEIKSRRHDAPRQVQ